MRSSAPHYLPWNARFVALLVLLLAATLILIELDVITFAYERLGLHHRTAVALLLATLLCSVINVPIARLRGQTVVSGRVVSAFGVRYVIPIVEDWPGTIIAVNLGGALLPIVLSAYLFHRVGHALQPVLVALLVAAVTHRFARVEPGVGGTIGTLVGADLLNLRGMRNSGAAVASIGGAGTLDGIFITGIVAVLLA